MKFEKIPCNKHFSYEPELFPAALISKWSPAHITLFTNGKGMVTGVRHAIEALTVLRQTFLFIKHHNDYN